MWMQPPKTPFDRKPALTSMENQTPHSPEARGQELLAEHDRLEGDSVALYVWLVGLTLDEAHALAHEIGKRTIARINEKDRKAR